MGIDASIKCLWVLSSLIFVLLNLWISGAYYVQYYAKGQRLQNMTYEESLIKYKEVRRPIRNTIPVSMTQS